MARYIKTPEISSENLINAFKSFHEVKHSIYISLINKSMIYWIDCPSGLGLGECNSQIT